MNLHRLLAARAAAGKPVRVGLIGAGKFGSMFLAQLAHTPGMDLAWIADLSPSGARAALDATGWSTGRADAVRLGAYAAELLDDDPPEVVIEATGDPAAGIDHALAAIGAGCHLVMVNVEADVLAGPLLAAKAAEAGVVYSLAYGDQPGLICELVDWARACGFAVVAAGKGTKYRPEFHASTPDTVWGHYGLSPEAAKAGGMNPQMFNSFLDGTKSAIEMAAVANATGLAVPVGGLAFPAIGTDRLADSLKPRSAGGSLDRAGMVEVISSERHEGGAVANDLRWGVYVTFEAPGDYTARCFGEYGIARDESGCFGALWRPSHLIGLELGISVASAALRGEATGAPTGFRGDVVAVAKRDLAVGEGLDGEGGYTVWGRLMPAADSLAAGALPIGLAKDVLLVRSVAEGAVLTRDDVVLDEASDLVRVRAEMEARFDPRVARDTKMDRNGRMAS
ncbi:MAG: Gfo/Idh/MocA family oxidoreductase [Rhodospirillaceae bacterium]|jgi:predicted homoserine dehydrogenase-like protein|nr:Gfo/Idh/MocA family oxidoreductase [Rhodospirillaceae bacterium]